MEAPASVVEALGMNETTPLTVPEGALLTMVGNVAQGRAMGSP